MGVRRSWTYVGLLVILVPATSWGSGRAHRHDGFFLRMAAGVGSASTRLGEGTNELRYSGTMADLDIAIGGRVGKDLLLHGTIWGWTIGDPDYEYNNQTDIIKGDLTMSALGMGLTYYVMPLNLYVSGSLGIAKLRLNVDRFGNDDSNTGVAFEATIGKEWWVSRNWALGVAGAAGLHSIEDGLVSDNWNGGNFAVRFSATYN